MPQIEFVTFDERVKEDFQPIPASEYKPDWWKKTKIVEDVGAGNGPGSTIRSCPAMADVLSTGYYVVAVRDMYVEYNGDDPANQKSDFNMRCPHHEVWQSQTHPFAQFAMMPGYINDAIKMSMPFSVRTPKGYSTLYLDPFLFCNEYISAWQGIIDTDNFIGGDLNAQLIMYPKVRKSFIIPAGTPIVQLIPYKREKWTSTTRVDYKDYWKNAKNEEFAKYREDHPGKLSKYGITGSYRKYIWQQKEFK
jgi:hypothetical protein